MKDLKEKKYCPTNIVIVLIIIILILIGFIIYKELKNSNAIENKNKYTLNIYKDDDNYLCNEQSSYCNTIAYTIKAETSNAKVIEISDNLILYDDNGLKYYNCDTNENKNVMLNNEYENYHILNEKYLSFTKDNVLYLYDIDNKNKDISVKLEDNYLYPYFDIYTYNNKNIYIATDKLPESTYIIKIYNNEKKEIIDGNGIKNLIMYEEHIYYNDNETVKKYDLDGKFINSIKVDGTFKNFHYDNIAYIKDNQLMLMNFNTGKTKKIVNVSNNNIHVESYYNDKSIYNYQITYDGIGTLCTSSENNEEILKKLKNGLGFNNDNGIEYDVYDLNDNLDITYYKLELVGQCISIKK